MQAVFVSIRSLQADELGARRLSARMAARAVVAAPAEAGGRPRWCRSRLKRRSGLIRKPTAAVLKRPDARHTDLSGRVLRSSSGDPSSLARLSPADAAERDSARVARKPMPKRAPPRWRRLERRFDHARRLEMARRRPADAGPSRWGGPARVRARRAGRSCHSASDYVLRSPCPFIRRALRPVADPASGPEDRGPCTRQRPGSAAHGHARAGVQPHRDGPDGGPPARRPRGRRGEGRTGARGRRHAAAARLRHRLLRLPQSQQAQLRGRPQDRRRGRRWSTASSRMPTSWSRTTAPEPWSGSAAATSSSRR